MTATVQQLQAMWTKEHSERLERVGRDGTMPVPPADEVAFFKGSPVGVALTAFFHNLALEADFALHSPDSAKDHDVNIAKVDTALEFFGELDRWDTHHKKQRGEADD